jgi:hypothetical protein
LAAIQFWGLHRASPEGVLLYPVVRAEGHPFRDVLRMFYWCFVASFCSVSCLGEAGRGAPGMAAVQFWGTVRRLKACFFYPVVRAKGHPFGGVLRMFYWCFVASFCSSVSCLGEEGWRSPALVTLHHHLNVSAGFAVRMRCTGPHRVL